MSAILAFLSAYKGVLLPILTALIGWLMPSPIQKAQKEMEEIHEKETGVDENTRPTSDLDKLP